MDDDGRGGQQRDRQRTDAHTNQQILRQMMSGSRLDTLWSGPGRALPVHPCGMTTTQTCETLQQSHRLLGDTYIKQLPFLLGSLSHGEACETGTPCCCRRFCSFSPLCLSLYLDGTARLPHRHPDQHQAFIMALLMLSDQSVCRVTSPPFPPKTLAPISPPLLLCLSPLTHVQGSWSSPLPLGLMEDGQRSVCDVQL